MRDTQDRLLAAVGSSNLSESALGSGVEWNYRDRVGAAAVVEALPIWMQRYWTILARAKIKFSEVDKTQVKWQSKGQLAGRRQRA